MLYPLEDTRNGTCIYMNKQKQWIFNHKFFFRFMILNYAMM